MFHPPSDGIAEGEWLLASSGAEAHTAGEGVHDVRGTAIGVQLVSGEWSVVV